ncbi:MAG TPA: DUF192 domain-containing protein [Spirochaetia bacterium]|nr:DUF192 domain-containing protein [Spirochaetia bacterium]
MIRSLVPVFLVLLVSCSVSREKIDLTVGGETFRVEVVRTPEDQARGLMFRKSLGEREGMLFVYPKDRRLSFWMKNTGIPLSIAFISRDGRIIQIEHLKPFDLTAVRSEISVRYALEVLEGTFENLKVEKGDRIIFPEPFR